MPLSIVNVRSERNTSCLRFNCVPSVSILSSCKYSRIRAELAVLQLLGDAEQDRLCWSQ